jgi:hypothetical protein
VGCEGSSQYIKIKNNAPPKTKMMITNQILMLVRSRALSYSVVLSKNDTPKINLKGLHTLPVVPVVVYSNSDADKERVTKENKGRSGVYR